jgi:HPt (histidine-containing phosphotransfer) domain-containing protein
MPRDSQRRRPVQAPEPILDEAVLAELKATTGDDPAFVRELVDSYLAEAPAQSEGIAAAISGSDAAALVRPAHTLKSSSATVGAMRLATVARRLEITGRSGALDDGASADLDTLRVEWSAAVEAFQTWLAGNPSR